MLMLLSGLCAGRPAPGIGESIKLDVRWHKGDKHYVQVKARREVFTAGARQKYVQTTYNAQILVLDSSAAGYMVQWTLDEVKPEPDKDEPVTAEDLAFGQMVKGLQIKFSTEADGSFKALENYPDIKSYLARNREMVLKSSNFAGMDKASVNDLREYLGDTYDTKEKAESHLLSDIIAYHFLYGVELAPELPVDFENQIAGGDDSSTIPTKVTMRLIRNKQEGAYEVSMDQRTDTQKQKAQLKQQGKQADIDGLLKVTDHNAYTLVYKTRWVKHLKTVRTAEDNTSKAVNELEITLTK